MTKTQQQTETQTVARPLKVLVHLIREDVKNAKEVADEAASPYYKAIGENLIEAKSNPKITGHWTLFLREQVSINQSTAWRWMDYAQQVKIMPNGHDFTFADYRRLKRNPPKDKTNFAYSESQDGTTTAHSEQLEVKEQKMKNLHALVKKAFDIGYKQMARSIHPDKKGGTNEAMSELNEAKRLLYSSLHLVRNE
jgi:hypothetical protein